MKKNLLNISLASLFALTIVWGVFLAFDWGEEYFATKQSPQYESLPFEFKLKSNPEDVIFSEAYKTEDGKDIVKYAYAAGEVGPQLNEDISRRTPESYTEVIDTFKDEEGKLMETLKTTFMSKPQFYQKEGKWRQVEYATTTPEIFAMSGAIPYVKKRELVEQIIPGVPVFALTSTFYPDPNTETSSVDGHSSCTDYSSNWSGCWAATSGDFSFDSDVTINVGASYIRGTIDNCPPWECYYDEYGIVRAFLLFATSALPDNATISSATASIYVTAQTSPETTHLVTTSPASNTGLTADDFDQVGSVDQATALSSFSSSAYNAFTLNSTGRGNISLVGVTKFGLRTDSDFINSSPGTEGFYGLDISSADTSGTSQDPKLEVVYTVPSTFSIGMWFSF